MNRGSEYRALLMNMLIVASMRPRFMNRGSCGWREGVTTPSTCFNEAPIHESGKSEVVGEQPGHPPELQ